MPTCVFYGLCYDQLFYIKYIVVEKNIFVTISVIKIGFETDFDDYSISKVQSKS